MTSARERLERIGLSQYFELFTSEGFDTWETILDITEADLIELQVKIGHRRKLQRAIAEARGQPPERALNLSSGKVYAADGGYRSDDSGGEAKESSGGRATPGTPVAPSVGASTTGTKRKYRRHPKVNPRRKHIQLLFKTLTKNQPDENAPERPPSAYVIFSNQVREELRGQELSFTEIAKLVGERWQVLSPEIRDTCERQAAAAKEKYYNELSDYKKTPHYAQYQQYLSDFKTKHAAPRTGNVLKHPRTSQSPDMSHAEGKRSRVETENPATESRHETLAAGHIRSLSNPLSRGPNFGAPGYRIPSSSISPAAYSMGMQSPINRQHSFSPQSSPHGPGSVYTSSYELPHHARSSASSSGEARLIDSNSSGYFPAVKSARQWQYSEEHHPTLQAPSDFKSRRSIRSQSSIPSLVYADTTHSSHGEGVPTTPLYHGGPLPAIETSKADRTLPHPLPSTHSIVSLPLDARPILPPPANYVAQQQHQAQSEGHWPALLRATQLARDADLKDEKQDDS